MAIDFTESYGKDSPPKELGDNHRTGVVRLNHQVFNTNNLCVCVYVFFTSTDRASTLPSNIVIYRVTRTVRGQLDRKKAKEHLQKCPNESINTKQGKHGQEKGNKTKREKKNR